MQEEAKERRLRRIALGLLGVLAVMAVVLLFISDNFVFPVLLLIGAGAGARRVWSEIKTERRG
jgi:uncharacterized membrane protein YccC